VRPRSHLPVAERLAEHGWSVMLYDGAIKFCSRSVRFVAMRSQRSLLAFSAMQSQAAHEALERRGRSPEDFDTLLVLEADRVLERSDAVLRLMERMDRPWPMLAALGRRIPRQLRDALYRVVAANRYRILGRQRECMLVGPELGRFPLYITPAQRPDGAHHYAVTVNHLLGMQ